MSARRARRLVAALGLAAGVAAQGDVAAFDAAVAGLRAASGEQRARAAADACHLFLALDARAPERNRRLPEGLEAAVLAGRPELALELAGTATADTPPAPLCRWHLAALARSGDLAGFMALADRSRAAYGDAVDAALAAEEWSLLPLADRALRRGERELGRAVFAALAGLEPAAGYRYANLGLCLRSLGELAAAERAYGRARALAPEDAQVENDWGLFLRATGRPDQALAAFRRSYALDARAPGGAPGLGPAVTNLLHREALRPGGAGPDPLPDAARALALRPEAAMLRRLVLDVGLDRLDGGAPGARDR